MSKDRIRGGINLYLDSLNKKFTFQVPTRRSQIKPFRLRATLEEAIKWLDAGDAEYAKVKLNDALSIAKEIGEKTDSIEAILKEFEKPLEEEVVYTFEELRNRLERINPKKFSALILFLNKLPEKHQIFLLPCFFENRERAYYSKLFKDARNLCEGFSNACGEEKEVLAMIIRRIDECLRYINPENEKKPAVLLQS